MKRKTLNEFLEDANKINKNKYDLSKIDNYPGSFGKITVICNLHGDFTTTPSRFLSGCGCPYCAKDIISNKRMKSTKDFVKQSKSIHGDKYNYDKTVYNGRRQLLTITCPIHGDIEITPENHLKGCGCSNCSHEKAGNSKKFSKEKFIENAVKVHGDKYNYDKSNYISMRTKLLVGCNIHGDFEVKPHDHIKNKTGCPICRESKLENLIRESLFNNNILYKSLFTWDWLVYKENQKVDFYLPEYNLVIECLGIQHFESVDYFGGINDFNDRKLRDLNKLKLCTEHGIPILYFSNLGNNYPYPYKVFTDTESLINEIKKIDLTSQS